MRKQDLLELCSNIIYSTQSLQLALRGVDCKPLHEELVYAFNTTDSDPQGILHALKELGTHNLTGHDDFLKFCRENLLLNGVPLTRKRTLQHLAAGRWLYQHGWRMDDWPTCGIYPLACAEKKGRLMPGESDYILSLAYQKSQELQRQTGIEHSVTTRMVCEIANFAMDRTIFTDDLRGTLFSDPTEERKLVNKQTQPNNSAHYASDTEKSEKKRLNTSREDFVKQQKGKVLSAGIDNLRFTFDYPKPMQPIVDRLEHHCQVKRLPKALQKHGFQDYEDSFSIALEGQKKPSTRIALNKINGNKHSILIKTNGSLCRLSRWSFRQTLLDIFGKDLHILWNHSRITHIEFAVDIGGIVANQVGGWLSRIKQVMAKLSTHGDVLTIYYGDRKLKIYNKNQEIKVKKSKNSADLNKIEQIEKFVRIEFSWRLTGICLRELENTKLQGKLPKFTLYDFARLEQNRLWDPRWNTDLRLRGKRNFLASTPYYKKDYEALIDSATITQLDPIKLDDLFKPAINRLRYFNPDCGRYDRKPTGPVALYEHKNFISSQMRRLAGAETAWNMAQRKILNLTPELSPAILDGATVSRPDALKLIRRRTRC